MSIPIKQLIKNKKENTLKSLRSFNTFTLKTIPLLSKEELNKRRCTQCMNSLQDYYNHLEKVEEDLKYSNIITKIKVALGKDEEFKKSIEEKEKSLNYSISRAEQCSKCKCLNCPMDCKFNRCFLCVSEHVIACDFKENVITSGYENKILDIKKNPDDKKEETVEFEVVGILHTLNKGEYIYLREVNNRSHEQLLSYTKDIRGNENYGALSEEELDEICSIFLDLKVVE